MYSDIGRSLSTDYFLIADQLTGEELGYLRRTRDFVDNEVLPVVNTYWERAEFPWPLVQKMAVLGIIGDGIDGYGCPPMSPIATGLVHMELNRGDGSLGTFLGVQAGLAMQSIAMLGSEGQRQRWLPPMTRLEKLGAFALTEPMHGSDAVALETSARRGERGRGVGDRRREEVDRQRHDRRRCRGVGPRCGGRPGQGVPGGEVHPRLRGNAD
jgi:glutaryl-CoA dehydrogenase